VPYLFVGSLVDLTMTGETRGQTAQAASVEQEIRELTTKLTAIYKNDLSA
jgi:hypothetical protein